MNALDYAIVAFLVGAFVALIACLVVLFSGQPTKWTMAWAVLALVGAIVADAGVWWVMVAGPDSWLWSALCWAFGFMLAYATYQLVCGLVIVRRLLRRESS